MVEEVAADGGHGCRRGVGGAVAASGVSVWRGGRGRGGAA